MSWHFFKKSLAASLLCSLLLAAVVDPSMLYAGGSDRGRAPVEYFDLVAVGGGLMAATILTLANQTQPSLKMAAFERLDRLGAESSDSWNNAGTGHGGLCELNYTPLKGDGTIETSKAVQINEAFEVSKQFWAYLVQNKLIGSAGDFIHAVPHFSWVHGAEDVDFLRKRYAALKQISLFKHLEYTEDYSTLSQWLPLMVRGRDASEPMAATRSTLGTDIDFGALTRNMFKYLTEQENVSVHVGHEVRDLHQNPDGTWQLKIRDFKNKTTKIVNAKKVFIGAGGGALPLLQRSGISEAVGYGGFPVSGQFLVCDNPALVAAHFGKVYGRPAVGSPPMSVPHLDTRVIDGRKVLIFGPFAGITTQFLRESSRWDLFRSVRLDNFGVMLKAGFQNMSLIAYLAEQATKSHGDRIEDLQEFIPHVNASDWRLATASQRVQIMKDEPGKEVLRLGTEVISSEDGSVTALVGASPGASTSAFTMIEILKRSFKNEMKTKEWIDKMKAMIPSYGLNLADDEVLATAVRAWTSLVLNLNGPGDCSQILEQGLATGG